MFATLSIIAVLALASGPKAKVTLPTVLTTSGGIAPAWAPYHASFTMALASPGSACAAVASKYFAPPFIAGSRSQGSAFMTLGLAATALLRGVIGNPFCTNVSVAVAALTFHGDSGDSGVFMMCRPQ